MLGNYVNAGAILLGSMIGLLVRNGIKDRFKEIVMQGIGLSVLFIGISSTLNGLMNPDAEPILFIICLVIGGIIGEWINIEKKLENLGDFLQGKIGSGENNISQGFVTASLLFCVGTMAIIGSLNSGLKNDHSMLFAKSVLDGTTSIVLAATLGIGVMLAAGSVFLYQGVIVLFATYLEPYLSVDIIRELTIIGGILIVGIGLTMLNIKQIKTANLLPAILLPAAYYLIIIPLLHIFI